MNAGEILALIFVTTIAAVGLAALMLLQAALLPRITARSKLALTASPRRSFFIGLANYIFLGGIALLLLNVGDVPGLLGLLILAAIAAVTVLGLAGLALHTGERLAELRRVELSPFKQMVWGALTLELATLGVPVLGWFIVAPIALMFSFGAAVVAWRNRKSEDGF